MEFPFPTKHPNDPIQPQRGSREQEEEALRGQLEWPWNYEPVMASKGGSGGPIGYYNLWYHGEQGQASKNVWGLQSELCRKET